MRGVRQANYGYVVRQSDGNREDKMFVRWSAFSEHHSACDGGSFSVSVQIGCPFKSALLIYSGYWCFQCDFDPATRETIFHFEMPEWSYVELMEAWDSPEGQGVSDVRRYVQAIKRAQHLQKLARHNQDGIWVDKAWIAGKRNKELEEKWT